MKYFENKLRVLANQLESSNPGLKIDVDKEIVYYHSIRDAVLSMTTDTIYYANKALAAGKSILVEGANATMIDIDFGTYPYVTSSNPSVGSVCTGLGVPPTQISRVCGIVKAYCTRVGEGPFPTELLDETGLQLRAQGYEYGTTTGRPRRCGWIDIPQLRYSALLNGFTHINLTKVDVLTGFKEIKIGTDYIYQGEVIDGMPASLDIYSDVKVRYETMPGWTEDISNAKTFSDLPINCQAYILRIEEAIGVPIKWIGVGPGRLNMIDRSA